MWLCATPRHAGAAIPSPLPEWLRQEEMDEFVAEFNEEQLDRKRVFFSFFLFVYFS